MEDYVTWVDTSKLKRTIMQYNDEVFSYQYNQNLSLIFLVSSLTTLIFYKSPPPTAAPDASLLLHSYGSLGPWHPGVCILVTYNNDHLYFNLYTIP